MDIDSASGMFYAPADKLIMLSRQATRRIGRATRNAKFFLGELHTVVGDRWGGHVRMTPQLRRDLQWWTSVPSQSNGKPIHRPADECQHITWKELKAVRLAVESFLHHLAGRNVLMHKDNQAVCHVPSDLISRSPEMMAELPRLWCLLDSHGIHMQTMQKIKYFGGRAMESSVVLDYIDPTVLPCPAAWHLFGWMTPRGGQPARLPRQMAT
eukprot:jgi/Tetstr1/453275/TSEL_003957.t1